MNGCGGWWRRKRKSQAMGEYQWWPEPPGSPGGRPLISHEIILNLIKATTTGKGWPVEAAIVARAYLAGMTVTEEELAQVHLSRSEFHGQSNHTISPRQTHSHCNTYLVTVLGPSDHRPGMEIRGQFQVGQAWFWVASLNNCGELRRGV